MRVMIDAAPLLVRSAGVKNYLYHWIRHLRRLAGADAVTTFPRLAELGPLSHEVVAGWPGAHGGGDWRRWRWPITRLCRCWTGPRAAPAFSMQAH